MLAPGAPLTSLAPIAAGQQAAQYPRSVDELRYAGQRGGMMLRNYGSQLQAAEQAWRKANPNVQLPTDPNATLAQRQPWRAQVNTPEAAMFGNLDQEKFDYAHGLMSNYNSPEAAKLLEATTGMKGPEQPQRDPRLEGIAQKGLQKDPGAATEEQQKYNIARQLPPTMPNLWDHVTHIWESIPENMRIFAGLGLSIGAIGLLGSMFGGKDSSIGGWTGALMGLGGLGAAAYLGGAFDPGKPLGSLITGQYQGPGQVLPAAPRTYINAAAFNRMGLTGENMQRYTEAIAKGDTEAARDLSQFTPDARAAALALLHGNPQAQVALENAFKQAPQLYNQYATQQDERWLSKQQNPEAVRQQLQEAGGAAFDPDAPGAGTAAPVKAPGEQAAPTGQLTMNPAGGPDTQTGAPALNAVAGQTGPIVSFTDPRVKDLIGLNAKGEPQHKPALIKAIIDENKHPKLLDIYRNLSPDLREQLKTKLNQNVDMPVIGGKIQKLLTSAAQIDAEEAAQGGGGQVPPPEAQQPGNEAAAPEMSKAELAKQLLVPPAAIGGGSLALRKILGKNVGKFIPGYSWIADFADRRWGLPWWLGGGGEGPDPTGDRYDQMIEMGGAISELGRQAGGGQRNALGLDEKGNPTLDMDQLKSNAIELGGKVLQGATPFLQPLTTLQRIYRRLGNYDMVQGAEEAKAQLPDLQKTVAERQQAVAKAQEQATQHVQREQAREAVSNADPAALAAKYESLRTKTPNTPELTSDERSALAHALVAKEQRGIPLVQGIAEYQEELRKRNAERKALGLDAQNTHDVDYAEAQAQLANLERRLTQASADLQGRFGPIYNKWRALPAYADRAMGDVIGAPFATPGELGTLNFRLPGMETTVGQNLPGVAAAANMAPSAAATAANLAPSVATTAANLTPLVAATAAPRILPDIRPPIPFTNRTLPSLNPFAWPAQWRATFGGNQ
jgi:hypothetical protein